MTDEPSAPLGTTLRAWREYRRLSLTDVTRLADIGSARRSWLSRVENNVIHTVSRERLKRLAKALEVPYHALQAGYLPPTDGSTAPLNSPLDTRPARRRASPQAKTQQTVEELRDDIRALSGRITDLSQSLDAIKQLIHVLMEEYSTVNLLHELSPRRSAPPLAPDVVAASAPEPRLSIPPTPPTLPTPPTPSISPISPISPLRPGASALQAEWREAMESIQAYADQASERPSTQPRSAKIGQRAITIHVQTGDNFARSTAGLDALTGDRCLVLDGVSECFVSQDAHKKRGEALVRVGAMSQAHFYHLIQSRAQRAHALETRLSKPGCHVRDLYTWRAIEWLAETGYYALDDRFAAFGAPPLTKAEAAETIEKLMGYIEGFHDTYEARFIENPQPDWPCYFMAKEGAYLLIEAWIVAPEADRRGAEREALLAPHRRAAHWATNANSPYVERDLTIHDTQTEQLFQRYFVEELWNTVPADGRNRTTLITRLKEQKKKAARRTFSAGRP